MKIKFALLAIVSTLGLAACQTTTQPYGASNAVYSVSELGRAQVASAECRVTGVRPIAIARDDYNSRRSAQRNEAFGTLAGAAIGAAIGNEIGNGNGRRLATVLGGVAGASIGGNMANNASQGYATGVEYTVAMKDANGRVGMRTIPSALNAGERVLSVGQSCRVLSNGVNTRVVAG